MSTKLGSWQCDQRLTEGLVWQATSSQVYRLISHRTMFSTKPIDRQVHLMMRTTKKSLACVVIHSIWQPAETFEWKNNSTPNGWRERWRPLPLKDEWRTGVTPLCSCYRRSCSSGADIVYLCWNWRIGSGLNLVPWIQPLAVLCPMWPYSYYSHGSLKWNSSSTSCSLSS